MLTIVVDNRETRLHDILLARDLDVFSDKINIEVKQLDIGDIAIDNMLFERKTLQDMLSSIRDGRFREQKARMMSSEYVVSYIVEGGSIINQDETLQGAFLNTIYRDNIPIHFVKNIYETATLILTIATRIVKDPNRFEKKQCEYINTLKVKTKKIDNIDKSMCFTLQLCQIPHISTKIARSLVETHKTLSNLIKTLEGMEEKERIKYLAGFEAIGDKKARTILEYIL